MKLSYNKTKINYFHANEYVRKLGLNHKTGSYAPLYWLRKGKNTIVFILDVFGDINIYYFRGYVTPLELDSVLSGRLIMNNIISSISIRAPEQISENTVTTIEYINDYSQYLSLHSIVQGIKITVSTESSVEINRAISRITTKDSYSVDPVIADLELEYLLNNCIRSAILELPYFFGMADF